MKKNAIFRLKKSEIFHTKKDVSRTQLSLSPPCSIVEYTELFHWYTSIPVYTSNAILLIADALEKKADYDGTFFLKGDPYSTSKISDI